MLNSGSANPLSRKVSSEFIQTANRQLQQLLSSVSGVQYVMLCSSDGFEITSISKKNLSNGSKIAAVSSSILAMIAAFLNEIQLTGCQSVTLDAENGKAFLTAIPSQHAMLLVTLTSNQCLLGQLIYEIKKTSEALIQLDQEHAA
ncbi:roadblock/LC7 domain-containing protein [Acinetobacter sp. ME22]|uniref:roadblock/LC7 domain-containing protein n=1 Tax=Acinetobacter sp. ME22 TaxID=2904802 RepID=UPI001EDB1CC4|nr:roadblock/LC7 domain-containing protein [Acinetobacter sp. ME22]MCG2574816.1 roadblock/LC7 domain-containing protein [Acinetobacter sp. ME22]